MAGSILKQLGDPAAVEGARLGGRNGEEGEEVPVLIVGAGPVGLTLSILLSKYGLFFLAHLPLAICTWNFPFHDSRLLYAMMLSLLLLRVRVSGAQPAGEEMMCCRRTRSTSKAINLISPGA